MKEVAVLVARVVKGLVDFDSEPSFCWASCNE